MSATRILMNLETLDLTGGDADAAARMGFLEWAFAGPGDVSAAKVAAALSLPEAQNPESAAAQAFVGFLRQAGVKITQPRTRKTRASRLH